MWITMKKINISQFYILGFLCIGCSDQYPHTEELEKAKEECVITLSSDGNYFSDLEENLYNYLNDIDEEEGKSAQEILRRAIRADNVECVEYALEAGADVNETTGLLNRPILIYAIENSDDPNIIRLLINKGVLINATTSILRQTPLMVASNSCDEDTVQVLLDANAYVHAESLVGQTALSLARNQLAQTNSFSLQGDSALAQKCENVISQLTNAEASQPQNESN